MTRIFKLEDYIFFEEHGVRENTLRYLVQQVKSSGWTGQTGGFYLNLAKDRLSECEIRGITKLHDLSPACRRYNYTTRRLLYLYGTSR